MLRFVKSMLLVFIVCFIASCNNDTVAPTKSGYKGTIYYSYSGAIKKIDLDKNTNTELFTNAKYPEMTKSGALLTVETYPLTRIIYTDLTGATRTSLLDGTDYKGPMHRRYMTKPRISADQKYVAYDGDNLYNPTVYIIDAKTGELMASVGDYANRKPLSAPSWFPDGSLVAEGWTFMNNGIYKIDKDFKTVTNLTPNLTNVRYPSASPDGTKIAFIRDEKLWIMNADGTNAKQLYTSTERFYCPTWSPDSKYIAAVEYFGHVFIIDPAAMTAKELTMSHYVNPDEQLSWAY